MKLSLRAKLDDIGIDEIGEEIARDLQASVAELAQLTYNKAVEMTNERLHGTRQDYINALHMEEEGPGVYVVYLDPEMNHLEDGYPAFPMLPKLAQGPKSKISKDGHRYVVIPMRKTTAPVNPGSQKQLDMSVALKKLVAQRRMKKVREGVSPKTGKYTTVERLTSNKGVHPHLQNLVRVREYKTPESKRPMSSAYFTFRTASEKQDPTSSWFHPGYGGAQIFPDLERWAESQLENIISEFFG